MKTITCIRRNNVVQVLTTVLLTINLLTVQCLSAQNYTTLDTIYTPAGFELGDLMATINIPHNSNGVGVVVAHGAYENNPFARHTMKIWCDTLASHGYVAMTIDYYSFDVMSGSIDTSRAYPRQATTFKIAVEFLRRNAALFNITTGKIVGFGMSGGSYHWGQSIIWDNDDTFFKTDSSIDDHLDAAILLYGFYDNYNLQPSWLNLIVEKHFSLNPNYRATKGNCIANVANITTPILLIHGTADQNVNYQHSVQLHDSLLAIGKSSQLVLFAGDTHGFDLTDYFPPHSFTVAGLVAKDTILYYLGHTLVSIEDQKSNGLYYIHQNYPNPFNQITNIPFSISKSGFVKLKVYNMQGQEVATLLSKKMNAGNHIYSWNAGHLPKGVYMYQLNFGGIVQSRKMILME